MIFFIEPHPLGGICLVGLTKEQAVKASREGIVNQIQQFISIACNRCNNTELSSTTPHKAIESLQAKGWTFKTTEDDEFIVNCNQCAEIKYLRELRDNLMAEVERLRKTTKKAREMKLNKSKQQRVQSRKE